MFRWKMFRPLLLLTFLLGVLYVFVLLVLLDLGIVPNESNLNEFGLWLLAFIVLVFLVTTVVWFVISIKRARLLASVVDPVIDQLFDKGCPGGRFCFFDPKMQFLVECRRGKIKGFPVIIWKTFEDEFGEEFLVFTFSVIAHAQGGSFVERPENLYLQLSEMKLTGDEVLVKTDAFTGQLFGKRCVPGFGYYEPVERATVLIKE